MLVKNTFHTLFQVSEAGELKLLADFVTKSEAEEWAQVNAINSYLVLETVVNHQVKITQQVTPARALRMTGEVEEKSSGQDPLKPRSGPIEGVRSSSSSNQTSDTAVSDDLKILEDQLQVIMQKISELKSQRT